MILQIIFWVFIAVTLFTYFGYGILAKLMSGTKFFHKKIFQPANKKESVIVPEEGYLPKVTLVISAFAEGRKIIREKIANTLMLNYPKNKLEIFFAVAIDTKNKTDETLDEYLNHFLNKRVPTGLNPVTEELISRFSRFETNEEFNDNELGEIISLLENVKVNSSEIDLDYKARLEAYTLENQRQRDLNWFITKDLERKGKISQVNRTIKKATGDIVVFSDANSMFNEDAILNIIRHFTDSQVGCVAGEKRIKKSDLSTSGDGEGLYWKYESFLKKTDSELYSTMGAAGEIFAVRRDLLQQGVPENAVIEDFVLSMKLVENGYRIVYEPNAYAEEDPTIKVQDEYKRRTRIAAGGFQSIVMLKHLLNPFKFRIVSFQFVSHRVLRWAVVPFLLPLIFVINLFLLAHPIYSAVFGFQVMFYLIAAAGYLLEKRGKKIKLFNISYVFLMMNVSAYAGLKRYLTKTQTVLWEKAKRLNSDTPEPGSGSTTQISN